MPYCVQCGKQVGPADPYCSGCGARQGGAPRTSPQDFWTNLPDRAVMQLCYIPWVGWIPAIAVIASDRFRGQNRVRFHGYQGLYLFVVWLIADWFLDPALRFGPHFGMGFIPGLLKLTVLGGWIFMLIKVSQDQDFRLPIIGEIADKSVAEQRF